MLLGYATVDDTIELDDCVIISSVSYVWVLWHVIKLFSANISFSTFTLGC